MTSELLENPREIESYEQLLIMFQGQEEGLLRAMQDIVFQSSQDDNYKYIV